MTCTNKCATQMHQASCAPCAAHPSTAHAACQTLNPPDTLHVNNASVPDALSSDVPDAPDTLDCVLKVQKPLPESAHELGIRGEQAAIHYLQRCGYEILEHNWHCFAGEADIIARDEDALVFVEVKTRSDVMCGLPSEAVDKKKRARYEKIALCYISTYDQPECLLRFDVISILFADAHRALLRHHINAFASPQEL